MRQAVPRSWSRHRIGFTCMLALLFAAGLAGCGYSSPTQAAVQSTVPAGEPTVTSTVAAVTPYIEVPTSTAGWQTYTDSTYHFKTVIPPGWRMDTILDTDYPRPCEYDVVYFPPGDTRPIETRVWIGMREYMRITVYLQCPPYDPTKDHTVTPMGKVLISGVSTTLYAENSDQQVEEVDRAAYAPFGGHSYTFILIGQSKQGTPTTADVPLYMRVLSDFVYLGGS